MLKAVMVTNRLLRLMIHVEPRRAASPETPDMFGCRRGAAAQGSEGFRRQYGGLTNSHRDFGNFTWYLQTFGPDSMDRLCLGIRKPSVRRVLPCLVGF